jgi:hypothetical protein
MCVIWAMELKYVFIVLGSANAICRLPFGFVDWKSIGGWEKIGAAPMALGA